MTVYKCTAFISGDGWKDTTRDGDVKFAYGYELPCPYAPGQYQTIGFPVSSVTQDQWRFERLGAWETLRVMAKNLRKEIRWHGPSKVVRMLFSTAKDSDND
jgi:hypothetical protein